MKRTHAESPLMSARYFEYESVSARLIVASARLDLVDKLVDLSLFWPIQPHRYALIEAGAALNQFSSVGRSALDEADKRGLASAAGAIRARGGLTRAELAPRAEA